jgi:hypothetical protein
MAALLLAASAVAVSPARNPAGTGPPESVSRASMCPVEPAAPMLVARPVSPGGAVYDVVVPDLSAQ